MGEERFHVGRHLGFRRSRRHLGFCHQALAQRVLCVEQGGSHGQPPIFAVAFVIIRSRASVRPESPVESAATAASVVFERTVCSGAVKAAPSTPALPPIRLLASASETPKVDCSNERFKPGARAATRMRYGSASGPMAPTILSPALC